MVSLRVGCSEVRQESDCIPLCRQLDETLRGPSTDFENTCSPGIFGEKRGRSHTQVVKQVQIRVRNRSGGLHKTDLMCVQ